MPLPRLRAVPIEPAEASIAIASVFDDERYREPAALLSAFNNRLQRLERQRLRLILQFELAAHPKGGNAENHRANLARLDAADAAEAEARPPPAAAPHDTAVAAGLAVLAGTLPPRADHPAMLAEIDRQLFALRLAIGAQSEAVKQAAEQISAEIATEIRPAWDQLQIEMYRAAQELARVAGRVRTLRNRVVSAGVISVSTILRMPNVAAPLRLGDEADHSSEISTWRRTLADLDILK